MVQSNYRRPLELPGMNEYDFDEKLEFGQKWEAYISEVLSDFLIWESGKGGNYRGPDFRFKGSRCFLELKACERGDSTGNLFIERWSKHDEGAPGGPWQAMKKGAQFYLYFLTKSKRAFLFKTKDLVDRFENTTFKLKWVKNKSWHTTGYAVSISYFDSMCTKLLLK